MHHPHRTAAEGEEDHRTIFHGQYVAHSLRSSSVFRWTPEDISIIRSFLQRHQIQNTRLSDLQLQELLEALDLAGYGERVKTIIVTKLQAKIGSMLRQNRGPYPLNKSVEAAPQSARETSVPASIQIAERGFTSVANAHFHLHNPSIPSQFWNGNDNFSWPAGQKLENNDSQDRTRAVIEKQHDQRQRRSRRQEEKQAVQQEKSKMAHRRAFESQTPRSRQTQESYLQEEARRVDVDTSKAAPQPPIRGHGLATTNDQPPRTPHHPADNTTQQRIGNQSIPARRYESPHVTSVRSTSTTEEESSSQNTAERLEEARMERATAAHLRAETKRAMEELAALQYKAQAASGDTRNNWTHRQQREDYDGNVKLGHRASSNQKIAGHAPARAFLFTPDYTKHPLAVAAHEYIDRMGAAPPGLRRLNLEADAVLGAFRKLNTVRDKAIQSMMEESYQGNKKGKGKAVEGR